MGAKITVDRVGDILAGLAALENQRVLIGIPDDNAGRKPTEDGEAQPINNAALGYIHEHGAPEANIPARPHLVPTVRENQEYVVEQYKLAAQDAMAGQPEKVTKRLHAMGLKVSIAVRRYIVDGEFEPLAASTLAGRKSAGAKGEKPLLRTGQMRNSYTYAIRKKGA